MFKNKNGHHKLKEHERNKQRVKWWYINNPDSTQHECAEKLGLARITVWRCIQAMRKEEKSAR